MIRLPLHAAMFDTYWRPLISLIAFPLHLALSLRKNDDIDHNRCYSQNCRREEILLPSWALRFESQRPSRKTRECVAIIDHDTAVASVPPSLSLRMKEAKYSKLYIYATLIVITIPKHLLKKDLEWHLIVVCIWEYYISFISRVDMSPSDPPKNTPPPSHMVRSHPWPPLA